MFKNIFKTQASQSQPTSSTTSIANSSDCASEGRKTTLSRSPSCDGKSFEEEDEIHNTSENVLIEERDKKGMIIINCGLIQWEFFVKQIFVILASYDT